MNDIKSSREKVESVVAGMAITENFWGYLFGRVRKIESENIPSIMGVGMEKNGSIILMIHPTLVEKTSEPVLEKVLEHEGLHLLNLHIPRSMRILAMEVDEEIKNQKMSIWNIAADCAVNVQNNAPRIFKIAGQDWKAQFPDIYNLPSDNSTESYYYSLLKQNEEKCIFCGKPKNTENEDDSDEKQEGSSGQSDEQEENKGEGDSKSSGNESNDQSCGCPYCGNKNGKVKANIDDHSEWDKNGETNNPEDLARKVEDQIKDLVRKSVKSYDANNRNRGNMPGYLKELIENLLDIPKIPYYQLIRSLIKGSRLSKWKKSYTRINKKRVYTFFNKNKYITPVISPFPGKKKDFSFNIVIMIDTSGSQSSTDIAEALSGIKDIIEHDRHCKVDVIEIDTKINKEYQIKKVSDIDFEISGRGGTVLREGIERAKQLNPDVLLGFTDGYCDDVNSFSDAILPKKIIWCISEGGSSERVNKTGTVVFVDSKK
ncbi:MAG: VWA-like domain-containing protein [bacterium]